MCQDPREKEGTDEPVPLHMPRKLKHCPRVMVVTWWGTLTEIAVSVVVDELAGRGPLCLDSSKEHLAASGN